ncbi:MAG: mechanosensitive ion channel family protein [Pseudomonadota bacterium]|nr:mechanosensitive ion channel family protein [Pseudomonadota bacterium]
MDDQLQTVDHVRRVVIDLAIQFGPRLLVASLIMVGGFYAANTAGRLFSKAIRHYHLDPPVRLLLEQLVRLVVLALFGIMALQNLGIELLPLIAGLGVAGAGVALAMQGVLGNVVAGLTIIFTRPFLVGDYISIVGEEGQVERITLFSTVLLHTDRSQVVIPNRKIVGEILHNYGKIRQLDILVGVACDADLDRALTAVRDVVTGNPLALADPLPVIGVAALGASQITLAVKPWVKVPDYVAAAAAVNKAVIERLRAEGITLPSAQSTVVLMQNPA